MWMTPDLCRPSTPTSPKIISIDDLELYWDAYRPNVWRRLLNSLDSWRWKMFWRCNPRHRRDVVRTGLKPGYYDTDIAMEACLIKLFTDFVEVERPFDKTHFGLCTDRDIEGWCRLLELYHVLRGRKPWEFSHDDLTGYLHELIDYRDWLWT